MRHVSTRESSRRCDSQALNDTGAGVDVTELKPAKSSVKKTEFPSVA